MPKRTKAQTIQTTLRDAIKASDESLYRIAKDAGLPYSRIHDFVNGKGALSLENADRLCSYFGLELVQTSAKETIVRC